MSTLRFTWLLWGNAFDMPGPSGADKKSDILVLQILEDTLTSLFPSLEKWGDESNKLSVSVETVSKNVLKIIRYFAQ